jgi:hypothetical protein
MSFLDPDPDFITEPIPDTGFRVKKVPDPGSGSATPLRKAEKCLRLIVKAQVFLLDELLLAVELVGEGEEDSLHMVGHRVILGTGLKQRHPSAIYRKKIIYLLYR